MDPPPPDPSSFQTLQTDLKAALLSTTRTTTALCAEDLSFHRSLAPSFARQLDEQNARLLSLAGRLLGNVAQSSGVAGFVGPQLADSDALNEQWRGVVDVVDSLLERADVGLDEITGLIKRGEMKGAPEVSLVFSLLFG
jgi:exosome complex exonuclease RRP6